jgi:pimeloyl-ACP methyl ester carboxylesterase
MQAMHVRNAMALLVAATTALAICAPAVRSYTRAAAFIVRMAGMPGWPQRLAGLEQQAVTVSTASVRSRHGTLRTLLYLPPRPRRAVVLTAGVNAIGIDEPRLTGLATRLAEIGFAVATPELPDLQRYDITPRTTDMIEDAALWLASSHPVARDGRVGLVGVSFAGGLSTVAAGRPALRDRVAFVFSFGGHSNFPRVLRFLCIGMEPALPNGSPAPKGQPAETYRRPHDYGVAILLLDLADRVVPPDQVEPLKASILTFLHASHMDLIDKSKAAVEFAAATRLAAALPEPARSLMGAINARDVETLGRRLLPFIGVADAMPALSPDRSAPPSAPVFLLHGTDDNVVPAAESVMLASYLRGKTPTRLELSSIITHAEMDRPPTASEVWRLVSFFAQMLRQ